MDKAALASMVEACSKEAAWTRPDSRVIDETGWFQVITPSAKTVTLNGVYETRLAANALLSSRISETIAAYRDLDLPFRWIVGETARPSGLAEILRQRGLGVSHELLGLVARVGELQEFHSGDLVIEKVSERNLSSWVEASAEGFGLSIDQKSGLASDMERAVKHPSLRYCVARYRGEISGSAALRCTSRSAYFVGASVVPRFRGKGIYRALNAHRARVAEAEGYEWLATQAMTATSAPVCLTQGFREVCRITVLRGWRSE